MRNGKLRLLILAALFAALDVVTVRLLPFLVWYLPPGTYEVRVSLQFLWYGLCGWLCGPVWALMGAAAADILGVFINPTGSGSFFPGYTLSAALGGLIFGLFLHGRSVRLWRCAAAVAVWTLVCGLALGALWSSVNYGKAWAGVILLQTPWRAGLAVLYSAGLYGVMRALPGRALRNL